MIHGIGIDIIEISRIAKLHERTPALARRVLHPEEQAQLDKLTASRQVIFLAGRFAAKEAFAKAWGTGIGRHLSWHDMIVRHDEYGAPHIVRTGSSSRFKTHLSISHSREHAVAQVIIEDTAYLDPTRGD